jgi:hypothetical protein
MPRAASSGGLSERPMDLVLKTSGQQCPVGSNPTPSATTKAGPAGARFRRSGRSSGIRTQLGPRRPRLRAPRSGVRSGGGENPTPGASSDPRAQRVRTLGWAHAAGGSGEEVGSSCRILCLWRQCAPNFSGIPTVRAHLCQAGSADLREGDVRRAFGAGEQARAVRVNRHLGVVRARRVAQLQRTERALG